MAQSQILWDNYPKYCVGFVPSPADDLEYLYHDKAGNLKPYNQHKFWGSGCFSPTIPHEEPKLITIIARFIYQKYLMRNKIDVGVKRCQTDLNYSG